MSLHLHDSQVSDMSAVIRECHNSGRITGKIIRTVLCDSCAQ